MAFVSLAVSCRQSEPFDLRPPKPPGLPIFAGDQLGQCRLLRQKRPRYPANLRYLGVQTVRLKCTILEDGSVAGIVPQTGPPELWPVARAAVARWRYEPFRIFNPMTGRSTPQAVITSIDLNFEP